MQARDGFRASVSRRCGGDRGFTIFEMTIVVLIIAVLVGIAIPVYFASTAASTKSACFSNQRALEGLVSTWEAANTASATATLGGIVDSTHPLITGGYMRHAPRCPSAPPAADINNPTPAEGAYTFDSSGTLLPCSFGLIQVHGHY
jgi:prepilin-type N-terminal cleavage/methylation domain-containing protein